MSKELVTRRRFIARATVVAAGTWLAPQYLMAENENILVTARQRAATAKITVQPLRENVSALIGSGGNIGVFTGAEGKLIIDSGYSTSHPQIADALTNISPVPIKRLINTHWHFDHTDGNEWMHAAGANILAHENTRKRLTTATRVEAWNFTFPPAPAGAIPAEVFAEKKELSLNGATVRVEYYQPSHTDGDISAYFVEADVLHCGDTWWNGHYPFIDYSTGGNIKGMIRAAEMNLARVSDKTIVIPGHGPIGGKPALAEYREMLVTVHDRIAALKLRGKTLEEVIAAKLTSAYDSKWATSFMTGDRFTTLVYTGA